MKKKLLALLTIFFTAASPSFAAIVDGMAGFATQNGGTTGGAGGEVVTVTNLADFMNAVRDSDPTPRTVYINAAELNSGDDKGKQVKLGNNKTIIGCGSGTFMNGVLLGINGKTNIIIRNLKFTMTSITNTTDPLVYDPDGDEGRPQILTNGGDCISIQGASSNIWIDHCEFYQVDPYVQTNQDLYDGLLDVKNGSQYITISWCYFHDHHKCHLVGSSDTDNYDRKITFHHNYYRNIKERMPSYRFGTGHVFNNYFYDVLSSGVNSRMEACLRVENNYMEDSNDPIVTKNSTLNGFWDLRSGFDNSENSNLYINSTGNKPTVSTCTLNLPYSYTAYLDAATAVKGEVMTNAGVGKITVSCGAPPTSTRTAVMTATRTRTNTAVPTATRTATVAVPSATFTGTRTITQTSTRTATVAVPSATFTGTRTATVSVPSETITGTSTAIPTSTQTASIVIPSATITGTSTAISTSTRTATAEVPSATFTATNTTIPTSTRTETVAVPSATNTMTTTNVPSATGTSTNTAVPTATRTATNTAVPSATITRTNTTIPSVTFTQTNTATSTATVTLTATAQSTATATPTATISWGDKFSITYILPYPNPVSGASAVNIKVTLTQPAQQLKVRLYTASFRRILEFDCGSSAAKDTVVTIPQERLNRLASGTYYLVITGSSFEGVKAVSKPAELIILK